MCVNPDVIQTTHVGSSKQKPFVDIKENTGQRLAVRSETNYPTIQHATYLLET